MRSMSEEEKSSALTAIAGRAQTQDPHTGLNVDDIAHPAYIIDYKLNLACCNEAARLRVLGVDLPHPHVRARNVFRLLNRSLRFSAAGQREFLRLYVTLAKPRISKHVILENSACLGPEARGLIEAYYDKAPASCHKIVFDTRCTLEDADGSSEAWQVYGVYFREGLLVIHVPEGQVDVDVLEFISRRDIAVRNLMRKQLPMFTSHAVLTASVGGSVSIRAQLPAERYRELIQEIWASMAPIIRKHRGSCDKNVGDGIQYSFPPQPDGDYLANAHASAAEMQQKSREIGVRWKTEFPGLPELMLRTSVEQHCDGSASEASSAREMTMHDTSSRPSAQWRALQSQTLHKIKALGATLMAKQRWAPSHSRDGR